MKPGAGAHGWHDLYNPNLPTASEYVGASGTPAAAGRTSWEDSTHFVSYINPNAPIDGTEARIVYVTVKWPSSVSSGRQRWRGRQSNR